MIAKIFIVIIFLTFGLGSCVPVSQLQTEDIFGGKLHERILELKPDNYIVADQTNGRETKSILYRTVKDYTCSANTTGSTLIVYGNKAWIFPKQDVNLTLSYPTTSDNIDSYNNDYWITSLRVIVYSDSTESRGYIIRGGMMQDHIYLSFISSGITRIGYEFWLYGNPKQQHIGSYAAVDKP